MNRPLLSDPEFATVASLLHDAAGLSFDSSRRDSLGYSVAERMVANQLADVPSYLAMLAGPEGSVERQALLDEVTIPETHFFRNPPQVRALRKYVLPELLKQAAAGLASQPGQSTQCKRLRVWSAGCSTGEEAYTIAILIRELLPQSADWDVKVIATDVSTRALAAARAAHYGERAFVMTDPLDMARWFVMDATTGTWVVRDEVRDLVEFRHHNLVTDPPPLEENQVDLILCRNVTIYFDRETTRRLMKRLHGRLRDGGYLFLGHAETLWQISDDFSLVSLGDAFVYRRMLETPEPSTSRQRWVLPDRRTEHELRPTRADRRRGDGDRRGQQVLPDDAPLPVQPTVAAQRPTHDPLDAVRAALTAGKYDEAADLAADVTAATPLWAQAQYLRGVALTSLGRDVDALVVLRKAVYLDQTHGFAHFLLGGALERLGEPVAASRSYRAAAGTLGGRPQDGVAPELGGRSVAELAAICAELADRTDPHARRVEGRQ